MTISKQKFDKLWDKAKNADFEESWEPAEKLINEWAKILNSNCLDLTIRDGYPIFLIDLSLLNIQDLDVNVIVVAKPVSSENERRKLSEIIKRYAESMEAGHSLCFVIFLQDQAENLDQYNYINLVTLDGQKLKQQFTSSIPDFLLIENIKEQIPGSRLCPFDTTRPATGGMFIGRQNEIDILIHQKHSSFILSGPRRCGKTSIMRRVETMLRHMYNMKDRVFYFDCRTWSGAYKEAIINIMQMFDHDIEESKLVPKFNNVIRQLSNMGKSPVILFFDEFDEFVKTEQESGWQLLNILSTATDINHLKLIFAGYRYVINIDNHISSPFYKRIKCITPTPFQKKDVFSLLIKTLNLSDIPVEQINEFTKKAFDETSGQPFMIQYFGEKLFNLFHSNDNIKALNPSHIDEIANSFEIQDYIYTSFYENAEKNEQQIATIVAFSNSLNGLNEKEIEEQIKNNKLKDLSPKQIHLSCRNLLISNIFKCYNSKYQIIFPFYKRILKERVNLSFFKN